MKIATAFSTHKVSARAIVDAFGELTERLGDRPHLIFLHCSVKYDVVALMTAIKNVAPNIPVYGGTSCVGIMTEMGFHCEEGRGLGMLGIFDPQGSYGVGAADLTNDPRAAAIEAGRDALRQSGRQGEVPDMVWIMGAPGNEEAVIEGLTELFGPNVPIGGGSSGDDTVSGEWAQFANGHAHRNAVVVAVLFASNGIAFSFHNGYDPTSRRAKVTKGSGRTIQELDGRPAAVVYNEWLDGEMSEVLPEGGNILMKTSLHPLGRVVGAIGGVPYFQLSHPNSITPEKGMTLFTNIAQGDEIFLMTGSPESLVTRAGRVARSTSRSDGTEQASVAGAMVIYCAGCMLTIRERMPDVVASLRSGLGDGVPFLGAFTFGEQGCFLGGENRHGNLMISLLLFWR